MKQQEQELQQKPDIIIATPGRLLDIMMNSKSIELSHIETLVLDEADRLLEMGFFEMITKILQIIQESSDVVNRQTLLLSATLSKDIKQLADLALKSPEIILEKKQQNSVHANLKLSHYFVKLRESTKMERDAVLLTLCIKHFTRKTVIFFNKKS